MVSDQHKAIVERWMYDVFAQGDIVALTTVSCLLLTLFLPIRVGV